MTTEARDRETRGRRRDGLTRRAHAGRLARSTAFFSFATGLSRVMGLVREVVAASLFGVSGAMSAFTIAFQVPNLMRALFADSALQGAFIPVFTELLEKGERQGGLPDRVQPVLRDHDPARGSVTAVFVLVRPADHGTVRTRASTTTLRSPT